MNKSPRLRFLIVLLFLLATLAGCGAPQPTEAQNRVKAYGQNLRSAGIRYRICLGKAHSDPAYVAVQDHFALPPGAATHEQLTDKTMPTDEDVANLRRYLPIQEQCRTALLDEMGSFSPTETAFYKKFFADMDAVLIDLIERKISWGESAQRRRDLAANVKEDHGGLRDKIAADLQKQHRDELRQRRMNPESYD